MPKRPFKLQHAYAAESLLPFINPGSKVLDVGSGSGYLCAVFHRLVTNSEILGKVVGIDHFQELVDISLHNLRKDNLSNALQTKQIEIICGDGRLGVIGLKR